MERYAQSETFYPAYQEPDSGVSAVAFGICRLSDGYWLDFDDSTFKASGWGTQYQALAEDSNGLWINTTGWAIANANAAYKVQFKVTDATGDFYADGPKIVVNDAILTEIADALLKRDMSAVTGEADRSPLNALRFLRNKWSISGTTLTVTKENDITAAWTSEVAGTAGANPITSSDPA